MLGLHAAEKKKDSTTVSLLFSKLLNFRSPSPPSAGTLPRYVLMVSDTRFYGGGKGETSPERGIGRGDRRCSHWRPFFPLKFRLLVVDHLALQSSAGREKAIEKLLSPFLPRAAVSEHFSEVQDARGPDISLGELVCSCACGALRGQIVRILGGEEKGEKIASFPPAAAINFFFLPLRRRRPGFSLKLTPLSLSLSSSL